MPTHGIVHAGFSGLQKLVPRKKGRCKLIGNRFVLPHDTIPSNVTAKCKGFVIKSLRLTKRKFCGSSFGRQRQNLMDRIGDRETNRQINF